jgi:hypothetical protein
MPYERNDDFCRAGDSTAHNTIYSLSSEVLDQKDEGRRSGFPDLTQDHQARITVAGQRRARTGLPLLSLVGTPSPSELYKNKKDTMPDHGQALRTDHRIALMFC